LGESLLKSKLYHEVAIMKLVHWLQLEEPSFDLTSPKKNDKGLYKDTPETLKLRQRFRFQKTVLSGYGFTSFDECINKRK